MSNKYYQVLVGNNELDKDQIHDPVGKSEIHFVPVISGAGGSSFNRILLGGALIGASFLFPGAGLFGTTSLLGSSAGVVGISTQGALLATKIGNSYKCCGWCNGS